MEPVCDLWFIVKPEIKAAINFNISTNVTFGIH